MKLQREMKVTYIQMPLDDLKASFGSSAILSFAVFGSVASGVAWPESDIDVLIVHKTETLKLAF